MQRVPTPCTRRVYFPYQPGQLALEFVRRPVLQEGCAHAASRKCLFDEPRGLLWPVGPADPNRREPAPDEWLRAGTCQPGILPITPSPASPHRSLLFVWHLGPTSRPSRQRTQPRVPPACVKAIAPFAHTTRRAGLSEGLPPLEWAHGAGIWPRGGPPCAGRPAAGPARSTGGRSNMLRRQHRHVFHDDHFRLHLRR